MPTKYVVVYVIPPELGLKLEEVYGRIADKKLPVRHLHISLTFSFFLKEGYSEVWLKQQIGDFVFEPISAWLTQFGLFTTHAEKPILYVGVEPFEPLLNLYKELTNRIRSGVEVDLTGYINREVPPFLPHISLDYDFNRALSVLSALQTEKISAFFEVDTLTVIRREGEAWEEI